jgi:hypothetical protein
MGISGGSSPENGLARAYELLRKLLPYEHKYNIDNPEMVFELLEKKAADGIRRLAEVEEQLRNLTRNPESIFFETGADLAAVNWYEALKKTGYTKDFLTFLSEIVDAHFEEHGFGLEIRESQT